MATSILVVDLGRPKFLLLAYFLRVDGFMVEEARSVEDGERFLQNQIVDVVVVNTVANPGEVAHAVHCFRQAGTEVRVVALHFGEHSDAHQPVRAHLCIHNPAYLDDVITPVTRFLDLVPRY